jgi:D-alanyl-D-alanine carboxypeptidase/D-alanyl-D-alanine-endopeptidase (penicillin-binding protein 4)
MLLNLESQLKEVIGAETYRHSFWGIGLADSATGELLYELNEDKLFSPASTAKLFSCAAALDEFGSGYRFVTPVYRQGDLSPQGVLDGDLILVGSGDPNLSGRIDAAGRLAFTNHDHTYADYFEAELTDTDPLAGIDDLARQIAESGLRQVRDIWVDDRVFDRETSEPGGPVLSSAVVVNDNVIDLLITPGDKPGEAAITRYFPQSDYARFDCQIETVEAGQGSEVQVQPVSPTSFTVRGKIELGHAPLAKIAWIEEPQDFARVLLIERLQKRGVRVERSLLLPANPQGLPPVDAYESLPQVARHVSPPFSELVRVVLKTSHNPMANLLPQLMAMRKGLRKARDGLRLQGDFLQRLGIQTSEVSFASGAGGSASDHVTPRATLKLLHAMASHRDGFTYQQALPVLGVDGTLSDAVGQDSPARGLVRAKTGTAMLENHLDGSFLMVSKALAGYLTTLSGSQLEIALFVNWVPLPGLPEVMEQGRLMGKICEILVHTI